MTNKVTSYELSKQLHELGFDYGESKSYFGAALKLWIDLLEEKTNELDSDSWVSSPWFSNRIRGVLSYTTWG